MSVTSLLPRFTYVTISILLLLMLSSCSNNTQDKLIGQWQSDEGLEHVLEFFNDGTVSLYPNKKKLRSIMYGQWVVLNDGRVKIVTSESEVVVNTVEFDGDKMTITEENKHPGKYKRY